MFKVKNIYFIVFFAIVNDIKCLNCSDPSFPEEINDCFSREVSDLDYFTCCRLHNQSPQNRNLSLCQEFNFIVHGNNLPKQYLLNNTIYEVTCQEREEKYNSNAKGARCGNTNSSNIQPIDCFSFSTNNNSCCYYNSNITNLTTCFWLGNHKDYNLVFESKNSIISCYSELIKFPFFLIFCQIILAIFL